MTAFIIVCIALFSLSLISNVIFILTSEDTRAGGVIGMIAFTAMIVWGIALLFN
jgi:hypothetical protein